MDSITVIDENQLAENDIISGFRIIKYAPCSHAQDEYNKENKPKVNII